MNPEILIQFLLACAVLSVTLTNPQALGEQGALLEARCE